ncbi:hypothetical protein CDAR_377881 [Caerostris darwini]|uniref:Uncharacterized protein n=1 Tax=Caerostris darwini TaxID=1538125 RepID=A0AAV4NDP4_9ARAC|nr:hypothetical protein CDAR_377881 [Caerostris darwini]
MLLTDVDEVQLVIPSQESRSILKLHHNSPTTSHGKGEIINVLKSWNFLRLAQASLHLGPSFSWACLSHNIKPKLKIH